MPLVQTRGAASAQGFGEFAQVTAANYIEDVFSTYLYTGNSSTQNIVNGIDLSGKGGMTWIKSRSNAYDGVLFDTQRGATKYIDSTWTGAEQTVTTSLTAFNANGFSLGSSAIVNGNASTYASWTFRKQPKFFDVVTYTGNSTNRTIAHNLSSVPGTIIVKRTDITGSWVVYHRSLGATKYIILNTANASGTYSGYWNDTEPTSSVFSVGGVSGEVNATGGTYVAYIFAHDAGGFGLTGTDNVISCGAFTTDGSGLATVSLGYEPQWVLFKQTDGVDSWYLNDIMRGMSVSTSSNNLSPNSSAAESAGGYDTKPTATGFNANSGIANKNYIYIAIRRGPMKVPTVGTSVFAPLTRTGTNAAADITSAGFPPDLLIGRSKLATTSTAVFVDRLRGNTQFLQSAVTDAEGTSAGGSDVTGFLMNGFSLGTSGGTDLNSSGASEIYYPMRRAPSFFDEVCYTGTGANTTQAHNLGVVPELMLVKRRSQGTAWFVYDATNGPTKNLVLNTTAASVVDSLPWNNTAPTSSVFSLGNVSYTNGSGATYVNYLFATCPGVSKVGSYTGTGAAQTINCGFTAGSRFVLIKRTDSTGDWYVWDSARGIVAGNDSYLLLNSTAAEVTSTDYIDTYSAGFEISSTAPAAINANGGSFIFFAVA
jgi:hypothetical protein